MRHRRDKTKLAIAVSFACIAVGGVAAETAHAHAAGFFSRRYSTDPPFYTVEVFFDRRVPGGATRARIADGSRAWTRQRRQVIYRLHREGVEGPGSKVCPLNTDTPRGHVYWKTIDGAGSPQRDRLGYNISCRYSDGPNFNRLGGFNQVYDSRQPNWYRGTGRVPRDRIDLWSVAVHEFGHATGWRTNHYSKQDFNLDICNAGNAGRETMCSLTYEGQGRTRTLGRHDTHTFRRVYAQRVEP